MSPDRYGTGYRRQVVYHVPVGEKWKPHHISHHAEESPSLLFYPVKKLGRES
jgi:hypothetical protein